MRKLANDTIVLNFRRSAISEADANIVDAELESGEFPSASFADLQRHLQSTSERQDPSRTFRFAARDALRWLEAIDLAIWTLHHYFEPDPNESGFVVPFRLRLLPDSQLPCGYLLAVRIGDKVLSTNGGPVVLDEVHYWLGSPLTRLAIVVYDRDGRQLAAWKSSVAQTVGSASDQNNDLPLAVSARCNLTVDFNPIEPSDVRLLTNCSLSRLLERAQACSEVAIKSGLPNDACLFLAIHAASDRPAQAASLFELASQANKPLALRPMALTQLGLMHARGTGVEQSSTRAYELFAEAAAEGWSQAMYNAGQCCLVGRGVDKNTERGIDLIRRAAELGNVDGLRYLAFAYAEGDEALPKDLTSAAKYGELLAQQGDKDWLYNCGVIYDQLGDDERALLCLERRLQWYPFESPAASWLLLGRIYARLGQFDKAADLLERGVALPRHDFKWELGRLYFCHFGPEKRERGCELIERSAFNSYQPAEEGILALLRSEEDTCRYCQYTLGLMYLRNNCVQQDLDTAVHYLTKAAEASVAGAQYWLSQVYRHQRPDTALHVRWLTAAAESGHAAAMSFLGAYYCDALHGFEPSRDKAVHYWTIAADRGDRAAAGWLAKLLYRERGPVAQIKALLKKACSGPEPHIDACFLFGEMHRTGDRINKNWIGAHKYLLKAANAEHPDAAYSLAKLLEEQQVDPEQARYWLERAADWGHAAAREQLGLLTSESDKE